MRKSESLSREELAQQKKMQMVQLVLGLFERRKSQELEALRAENQAGQFEQSNQLGRDELALRQVLAERAGSREAEELDFRRNASEQQGNISAMNAMADVTSRGGSVDQLMPMLELVSPRFAERTKAGRSQRISDEAARFTPIVQSLYSKPENAGQISTLLNAARQEAKVSPEGFNAVDWGTLDPTAFGASSVPTRPTSPYDSFVPEGFSGSAEDIANVTQSQTRSKDEALLQLLSRPQDIQAINSAVRKKPQPVRNSEFYSPSLINQRTY